MGFDPWTLWSIVIIVTMLVAGAMMLAWAASPTELSLPYWAAGLFCFAFAIIVGLVSDRMPLPLAIFFGNGAILTGYSLFWASLRSYCGRALSWRYIPAAALLWGLLCLCFTAEPAVIPRLIVLSVLALVLLGLAGRELWQAGTVWRIGEWGLMTMIIIMIALQLGRLVLISAFAPGMRPVMMATHMGIGFGLVALTSLFLASFLLVLAVRERREATFRHAARRDELTGLPNRRDFYEQAALICRQGEPLTMMLIDLDYFKLVNDRFGHSVGDQVLAAFGRVLLEGAPAGATAGRLGGEEFGVLLAGIDLAAARQEAARVQRAFLQVGIELKPDGTPLNCTASIGLVHVAAPPAIAGPASQTRLRTLLARADDVLYRAKHAGRNRIEVIEISAADLDAA